MSRFKEGEILGVTDGGQLIQWDSAMQQAYRSGKLIQDIKAAQISQRERARLTQFGHALPAE